MERGQGPERGQSRSADHNAGTRLGLADGRSQEVVRQPYSGQHTPRAIPPRIIRGDDSERHPQSSHIGPRGVRQGARTVRGSQTRALKADGHARGQHFDGSDETQVHVHNADIHRGPETEIPHFHLGKNDYRYRFSVVELIKRT